MEIHPENIICNYNSWNLRMKQSSSKKYNLQFYFFHEVQFIQNYKICIKIIQISWMNIHDISFVNFQWSIGWSFVDEILWAKSWTFMNKVSSWNGVASKDRGC
jgi:hypothetical protein